MLPNSAMIKGMCDDLQSKTLFFLPLKSHLITYPDSSYSSLPIHLAYKRGSHSSVARLLLDAYPDCADIADRKGRTPRSLATTPESDSSSVRQRDFAHAFKSHLASQERLNRKLENMKRAHRRELMELERKNAQELSNLEKTLEVMEGDVVETHRELEKKIVTLTKTESLLIKQVNTLDKDLKKSERAKYEEIVEMQRKLAKVRTEREVMQLSLEAVVEASKKDMTKMEQKIADQEHSMQALLQEVVSFCVSCVEVTHHGLYLT